MVDASAAYVATVLLIFLSCRRGGAATGRRLVKKGMGGDVMETMDIGLRR